MNRNYELIIFDLGNVLLNYDHRITCRKLSKLTKNKHSTEEIYNFLFKDTKFILFPILMKCILIIL